tara:strand:- start:308 stop:1564 length:1257 start_codon:yes stop_codon:yes gene_type:complete
MKSIISLFFLWIITIIFSIIWTFENPEKIEKIKSDFKKNEKTIISTVEKNSKNIIANSFTVAVEQVLEVSDKTAFIIYPKNEKKFDISKLEIYTQKGFLINNLKSKKLNLPEYFTLQRNGGIKTIISLMDKKIALISGNEKNCFFAALILLSNGNELFRSKCLPALPKNNDFNGLGSSNVHFKDKILLTLGTPEKHVTENSLLAQNDSSKFGKILEIDKKKLIEKINDNSNILKLNTFSKGHRVPQGLTIMKNNIFNVEHGPKGGDELNLVLKGKNYGWPNSSYGTNYLKNKGGNGQSYPVNHEKEGYEEPLFAFVPSVGISSLNNCPSILKEYYNKPCLMALSLYGNNLRKGNSIIIFLLNETYSKVNSIEKILLDNTVLRHFVTDKKNILYEDVEGNIYVSADKKGIYKITFKDFR